MTLPGARELTLRSSPLTLGHPPCAARKPPFTRSNTPQKSVRRYPLLSRLLPRSHSVASHQPCDCPQKAGPSHRKDLSARAKDWLLGPNEPALGPQQSERRGAKNPALGVNEAANRPLPPPCLLPGTGFGAPIDRRKNTPERQNGSTECQNGMLERQTPRLQRQNGAPERRAEAPERRPPTQPRQTAAPDCQTGAPERRAGAPERWAPWVPILPWVVRIVGNSAPQTLRARQSPPLSPPARLPFAGGSQAAIIVVSGASLPSANRDQPSVSLGLCQMGTKFTPVHGIARPTAVTVHSPRSPMDPACANSALRFSMLTTHSPGDRTLLNESHPPRGSGRPIPKRLHIDRACSKSAASSIRVWMPRHPGSPGEVL